MDEEQTNEHPETFETVVAKYEAPLLRYAARIVSNQDAAQDVVQSTFIKLFRHWKPESHSSPQLSSWLYRVTHNGAIDYLRKETRHRTLLKKHTEERQTLSQASRKGPGISDTADLASRLLKRLNLREQQLVILKVYEEKSYREISEITELNEGNVGYILHHAMKKLGRMLREEKRQGERERGEN